LKEYIDFNTNIRKKCIAECERDIPKLYNNSIFGKTIENTEKRISVEIIQDSNKFKKLLNKGKIKRNNILNSNLVISEKYKKQIIINKPNIIGCSILDISKAHMYKSFYELVKIFGRDKINLNYIDTDSLIIHFKYSYDYVMNKLKNNDMFDFSKLPQNSEYYNIKNKDVVGKFKDVLNGKKINRFIALNPKNYCYVTEDEKEKITSKGVNNKQKNTLTYDDYVNCLINKEKKIMTMHSIKANKYEINIEKYNKIALDYYDDKRIYLNDIYSLPYGNHNLN